MKWVIQEMVRPVATRVGGQVGAVAVGLGLAGEHQAPLAAIVAWGLLTLAECVVSASSRAKFKERWGRN